MVARSGERLRGKGRHVAGKTVWSVPERFKVVCIPSKTLYKCSALLLPYLTLGHYWLTNFTARFSVRRPFSFNRQHVSYAGCLEVRREIIRTVLCCTVSRSYAESWAHLVLTVLWIGFCHTGSISLCVDLFVFMCVFCFFCPLHMCYIIVKRWGGPDGIEA